MRSARHPLVAIALIAAAVAGPAPGFALITGPDAVGEQGRAVAGVGFRAPLPLIATDHLMP